MSVKQFASQADLQVKKTSFIKLSDNAYAYTAEGDPNSGVIVGDDAVMVIDTTATPLMAQELIRHIRSVTDLPIKYVTLTHYHAVRVLGASAYFQEGGEQIIAWCARYAIRDRAFSASVCGCRVGAGSDLAHHGV